MKKTRCTYEDVKNIVENAGYKLISKEKDIVGKDGFVSSSTKITVKCDREHEPYEVVLNNFKNNNMRCKKCYIENRSITYENIKNIVEDRGYELLSKKEDIVKNDGYIDVTTKIKIKCNKGHEYNVILNNFKNNNTGCKRCYNNQRCYTYEDIKNIVESMGYELVSKENELINEDGIVLTTTRIKVKKECDILLSNLINGGGDKKSKGEKRIEDVLNLMNISYINQYRFDDCRYKYPLPFDFYLPKYKICIEYDGEQHYESIEQFGGEEYLKDVQLKDEIKTKYCKKHKIKLIRIPYWKFDKIEEILKGILNK